MRQRPLILATAFFWQCLAGSIQAQDDLTAAPKGYDESFQTGDIPKPKEPELDPDLANENELSPDQSPDSNPDNDPARDRMSDLFMIGGSAAIALPHVLNLGIESMIGQRFGISVNYGNATRTLSSVDVGVRHTDLRLRWFPWAGSFFVGSAFGSHKLTGELNRVIYDSTTKQNIAVHGKLSASANYIAPHFGWFSVWDSGFTMGCDFGYLMPSGVKSSFSSNFGAIPSGVGEDSLRESGEYKEMRKDLEDSAKKYASMPLPFVTLMRIGWMF
jgi:hypothetical protein